MDPVTMSPERSDTSKPVRPTRSDDFIIVRKLGKGFTGDVYEAIYLPTSEVVALKICGKTRLLQTRQVEHVRNECDAMRATLASPFVVDLYLTFQDDHSIYLVEECLSTGNMFKYLSEHKYLSNNNVRYIISHVVMGLEALHQAGYVYRDLKHENLLLTSVGTIKLADLGFCKKLKSDKDRTFTRCGTEGYVPPEQYQKKGVSFKGDLWALGIIMYEMLARVTPFYVQGDASASAYRARSMSGQVTMWPKSIPSAAKDLIQGLLNPDEDARFSLEQVKAHRYFRGVDWGLVAKLTYHSPLTVPDEPPVADQSMPGSYRVSRNYGRLTDSQQALFVGF